MSSRTPVAVAVVVVRGCRVAIFRRFVPNVFGSVCPRSASWCGSSHIRLPLGAVAAAARAGFFVGEVSSVFLGVLRLKFLRSPSTSRVSLSILRSSSCWATSQSAFSRRRVTFSCSTSLYFSHNRSIERCMSASMSLRRLRRLTSQVTVPARKPLGRA